MMIDIGLPPHEYLSNFTEHTFVFRGVPCGSMEGLLQSLKFPIPEKQLKVAMMSGIKAKRIGQKKKWYLDHILYWQGKPICRFSEEYRQLIKEAFEALFHQSHVYRQYLLSTGTQQLSHSMGKSCPKRTVLTEQEFVSTLEYLRDSILK